MNNEIVVPERKIVSSLRLKLSETETALRIAKQNLENAGCALERANSVEVHLREMLDKKDIYNEKFKKGYEALVADRIKVALKEDRELSNRPVPVVKSRISLSSNTVPIVKSDQSIFNYLIYFLFFISILFNIRNYFVLKSTNYLNKNNFFKYKRN